MPVGLQAPHIVIVGAGVSGTLMAINLLREPEAKVTLIEREPRKIGRGIAYATDDPTHLLNVRAANMSAFPDQPDHFLNWLKVPDVERNRFVPRQAYGAYTEDLLETAFVEHADRSRLVTGQALSAERIEGRWTIGIAEKPAVIGDILILAQGNLPPANLRELSECLVPLYQPDPWARTATEGLDDQDSVLLIGTGLTAIDLTLSLVRRGFGGRILALSRRGLKPAAHAELGPKVGRIDRPSERGAWLIRQVRQRANAIGWRAAVDELRPHTQDIWRRMSHGERERFLRHARPFWDTHRHRLAPSVAARITQMEAAGQLRFLAGKIDGVDSLGCTAYVSWRPRGSEDVQVLQATRIINCTGPLGNLGEADDPLIRDLLRQGLLRPDRLKLGVDVDAQGKALDSAGRSQSDLLAIGPMARGEAWEITAVPDIRRQVWDVARHLTHSEWVEASGL